MATVLDLLFLSLSPSFLFGILNGWKKSPHVTHFSPNLFSPFSSILRRASSIQVPKASSPSPKTLLFQIPREIRDSFPVNYVIFLLSFFLSSSLALSFLFNGSSDTIFSLSENEPWFIQGIKTTTTRGGGVVYLSAAFSRLFGEIFWTRKISAGRLKRSLQGIRHGWGRLVASNKRREAAVNGALASSSQLVWIKGSTRAKGNIYL